MTPKISWTGDLTPAFPRVYNGGMTTDTTTTYEATEAISKALDAAWNAGWTPEAREDFQKRLYTPERAAQGFRNQAHLDAFYAYYDHTQTCETCQQPGPAMVLDDGMQATQQRCDEANRLFKAFYA